MTSSAAGQPQQKDTEAALKKTYDHADRLFEMVRTKWQKQTPAEKEKHQKDFQQSSPTLYAAVSLIGISAKTELINEHTLCNNTIMRDKTLDRIGKCWCLLELAEHIKELLGKDKQTT
jgi:hypothetical protein